VFGLSLVLAYLVYFWEPLREPEESRVGYTAKGCYEWARRHMDRAADATDRQKKAREHVSATRYLRALEERFGVTVARWDAYEMLGDAERGLAAAYEYDRSLARRLRLGDPREAHAEALRAYRAAALRLRPTSLDRPRILRKQAEMLLALGRPAEASDILRDLVKLYRQDEVDRLRREREEGLPSLTSETPSALTDEVRTVYFLAGRAALGAAREREARSRATGDAELAARAAADKEEARRAFGLFLDAGGGGRRRAEAETSLGDLAFARAENQPADEARRTLEEKALPHYRSAGTPEAAFLLARVLFRMEDYNRAGKSFARRRDGMGTPEVRARSYMEARCHLALGRIEEAEKTFRDIRAGSEDDAEGASSLVGLAEIARSGGRFEEAADLLLGAAGRVSAPDWESGAYLRRSDAGSPRSEVELPERDRELERPRLARKLVEVAEALEREGKLTEAVDIYRKSLDVDPEQRARVLRRVARAWERKAEGEQPGSARLRAAEAYVELADVLPSGEARREALRVAAECFHEGGSVARAVEVARRFVREHSEDELASRMMHFLGVWEDELGLAEEADGHLARNVELHPGDVYGDRSRIARARLLESRWSGKDPDEVRRTLRRAQGVLLEIVNPEGETGKRYAAGTLVRLEALFLLGHVDVRLAEITGGQAGWDLYFDALKVLAEALDKKEPKDFPASGKGARPLFRELVDKERPAALLARGTAWYGLASLTKHPDTALIWYKKAGDAFRAARDEGAGERAEFYEALAECGTIRAEGKTPWSSAKRALASLASHAPEKEGILPRGYWQDWSTWIAEQSTEGKTNGGAR
jgi:tetratricopeptide (TPR) repeat protein